MVRQACGSAARSANASINDAPASLNPRDVGRGPVVGCGVVAGVADSPRLQRSIISAMSKEDGGVAGGMLAQHLVTEGIQTDGVHGGGEIGQFNRQRRIMRHELRTWEDEGFPLRAEQRFAVQRDLPNRRTG